MSRFEGSRTLRISLGLLATLVLSMGGRVASAADGSTNATTKGRKPAAAAVAAPASKGYKVHRSPIVEFSYISWAETATASGGGLSQSIPADLFGNALSLEEQFFRSLRLFYTASGALVFGLANVGGSQTVVPYHLSNQHFIGLVAAGHVGYRFTPQVEVSIGPMAMYRSLNLPTTSTATDIQSGSSVNFGLTGDTRLYLATHWLIRFELGSLLLKAATFWSLGAGYRF